MTPAEIAALITAIGLAFSAAGGWWLGAGKAKAEAGKLRAETDQIDIENGRNDERRAIECLQASVEKIVTQLHTNGGSSLRDSINRLERGQEQDREIAREWRSSFGKQLGEIKDAAIADHGALRERITTIERRLNN